MSQPYILEGRKYIGMLFPPFSHYTCTNGPKKADIKAQAFPVSQQKQEQHLDSLSPHRTPYTTLAFKKITCVSLTSFLIK